MDQGEGQVSSGSWTVGAEESTISNSYERWGDISSDTSSSGASNSADLSCSDESSLGLQERAVPVSVAKTNIFHDDVELLAKMFAGSQSINISEVNREYKQRKDDLLVHFDNITKTLREERLRSIPEHPSTSPSEDSSNTNETSHSRPPGFVIRERWHAADRFWWKIKKQGVSRQNEDGREESPEIQYPTRLCELERETKEKLARMEQLDPEYK